MEFKSNAATFQRDLLKEKRLYAAFCERTHARHLQLLPKPTTFPHPLSQNELRNREILMPVQLMDLILSTYTFTIQFLRASFRSRSMNQSMM